MANETRVNLKHLLEDLRDAYTSPVEEVIITELIANALDSGASSIALSCDAAGRAVRCTDDGQGMNRAQLRNYHNIAASTKERGFGIGFAGVGAKLSLLVASSVVTESRGKYGTRAAASWYLHNAYRAPWKFVPFSGAVATSRGTAVTIRLKDGADTLLDPAFLERTVKRHFYPLIVEHAGLRKVMGTLYKKPVTIAVNGKAVTERVENTHDFLVRGKNSRATIGAGFIERAQVDRNFWNRFLGKRGERLHDAGLKISTYGKVIKGGWEWLGISPKNPELVSGIVEIPELSRILTTNKADFMTDTVSMRKYYQLRKAVQSAVQPLLRELGESREGDQESHTPVAWKPLTRDIENALSSLSRQFPELESIVGARRVAIAAGESGAAEKHAHENDEDPIMQTDPSDADAERGDENDAGDTGNPPNADIPLVPDAKGDRLKRVKRPKFSILFDPFQDAERHLLGRLADEVVHINTRHPAWETAQSLHLDQYHVVVTVGLLLAQELRGSEEVGEFMNAFLGAWGAASRKAGRLF